MFSKCYIFTEYVHNTYAYSMCLCKIYIKSAIRIKTGKQRFFLNGNCNISVYLVLKKYRILTV